MSHKKVCLVLLRSRPDTVHRILLHKTRASTPLAEGSFTPAALRSASPLLSGMQVQGTANAPAAR